MTIKTHSEMVQQLKSKDYSKIADRLVQSQEAIDILHAILGIFTEGAEMADALKRHIFYGTTLDVVNLKEESGDLLWYIQLLLTALGVTLEEALDVNEAKLRKRYGSQFTEHAAVNRDLEIERKILER